MKYLHDKITLCFALLCILCAACKTTMLPTSLSGSYEQTVPVAVREGHLGDFTFIRSPEPVYMQFVIADDGTVSGTIGNAVLTDAACTANRGELGRALHVKTDYIIRGMVIGQIFPGDNYTEKEFSIPFNAEDDRLQGTVFHLNARGGLYPLADMHAQRTL